MWSQNMAQSMGRHDIHLEVENVVWNMKEKEGPSKRTEGKF